MRVAIVTTSYPAFEGDPSGHFVETEAKRLAREASVVVFAARGAAAGVVRPTTGLTVVRLASGGAFGWPGAASRLRARPWRALSAAAWVGRVRAALRSRGPFDRLVAHWAVPSAWPIAEGIGGELEVVSHGGDVRLLRGLPGPWRRYVVGRLARRASTWRFVSSPLLADLERALDPSTASALARVARVEPCDIELHDVRERALSHRAEHAGRTLYVCVARLVESKAVDRAISYVAAQPAPRRLVVVGDGPERRRLERLAAAAGVDTRFVGRTSRPEALAWIAAADALVHASREEGLSTVVREAEALGTRVERVAP